MIDFLTLINDSNSTKNEETGEIILTVAELMLDEQTEIATPCKISSSCNTVIKGKQLKILASDVSISNLFFEIQVSICDVKNFTFQNCTMKNVPQVLAALTVSNSENVTFSHITISDSSKSAGILIGNSSFVVADHLLLHDLSESLLVIRGGSYVIISDSTFYQGGANAIHINDQSYIEISNSTFSDISYPAIYVNKSQCSVKSSKFEKIDQNAITSHYSSDFHIEKNEFTNVKGSAISILDESKGIIRGNKVYSIEGNGVYCRTSEVEVLENSFSDLTYPGIIITTKSKATIVGNKISRIKYSGIGLRGAIDVRVEDNEIEEVNESCVSISDTENCLVVRNRLKSSDISAVESYNNSKVFIQENIITNSKKYAFLAYTSGYMKAENNTVSGVDKAMVKLVYKGGGEFVNNSVEKCEVQCDCQTSSSYFLSGNGDFEGVTNDSSRSSASVHLDPPYVKDVVLCLMCNKNPRDYYLLDCGHKVYCKECATKAIENKEECPLCRFPIVSISPGFDLAESDSCIICLENKPDAIILPCSHMGVCSACLENWFKNKSSCPICRTENCVYKKISGDL